MNSKCLLYENGQSPRNLLPFIFNYTLEGYILLNQCEKHGGSQLAVECYKISDCDFSLIGD